MSTDRVPPEEDAAAEPGRVDCAAILERVDYLAELFRRRLIEDRTKQRALDELQLQIARADATIADAMRPLISDCIRIIDRIEASGDAIEGLSKSVSEELEVALERNGVSRIATEPGDLVDPEIHEVMRVEDSDRTGEQGSTYRVVQVVRSGFTGIGLRRPARVIARADTGE